MVLDKYEKFMKKFFKALSETGLDISDFTIDHIAYLAADVADYDSKKVEFMKVGTLISEKIVGGIHVAILQLEDSLKYNDDEFDIVEIIEPKEALAEGGWEHVEFISEADPGDLLRDYPDLEWSDKLDRDIFPMLTLSLGNGMKAKFPRLGAVDEVDRQSDLGI